MTYAEQRPQGSFDVPASSVNGNWRSCIALECQCERSVIGIITALHVSLNVGWAELAQKVKVAIGKERAQLIVGFLPVT